jgi:hypothetical protein
MTAVDLTELIEKHITDERLSIMQPVQNENEPAALVAG